MGKLLGIVVGILVIIGVGFLGYNVYIDGYLYRTAPHITYTEALNQESNGDGYFVYYYQPTCTHCETLKPDITSWYKNNSAQIPMYLVDMTASENETAWFDWDAYHAANDIIIGTVDPATGANVYNDGLTQEQIDEKYPSDVYTIETAANGTDVIAYVTPTTSVNQITSYEDISIQGTPTLIYINEEGKVEAWATGVEESLGLLSQHGEI